MGSEPKELEQSRNARNKLPCRPFLNVRKGLDLVAIILGDEAHPRPAFVLRGAYKAPKQRQKFLNLNWVFFLQDLLAEIPYAGVDIDF